MSQVNSTCCSLDAVSPKLLTFVHATLSFCLLTVINLQLGLKINCLSDLNVTPREKAYNYHKLFPQSNVTF